MVQIWFAVLIVILLWYIVVTILVAVKGLHSLREMLRQISEENPK